jgi:hypothetical protein
MYKLCNHIIIIVISLFLHLCDILSGSIIIFHRSNPPGPATFQKWKCDLPPRGRGYLLVSTASYPSGDCILMRNHHTKPMFGGGMGSIGHRGAI